MWSCAWAAACVEGLANGENREGCSIQRPWRRQNWISSMVSTKDNHCSRRSTLEWYSRHMQGSGQISTCQVVSGSCPQQGHRALSHFLQRYIIWLVAEWPEMNFEIHSQYNREVAFKAVDRAGKLIIQNPVGEIYCFFPTMYLWLCSARGARGSKGAGLKWPLGYSPVRTRHCLPANPPSTDGVVKGREEITWLPKCWVGPSRVRKIKRCGHLDDPSHA